MSCFLIVTILLLSAHGKVLSNPINDTFAVNIGAGYGVGIDEDAGSSSLPKSTTKVIHTGNYLSEILSKELLTNENNNHTVRNDDFSKSDFEDFQNFDSRFSESARNLYQTTSAEPKNIRNDDFSPTDFEDLQNFDSKFSESARNLYQTTFTEPRNIRPDLEEIQTLVNTIGDDSKYSKVVQIVKVPAVYEIHLQSNILKEKQKNKNDKPTKANRNSIQKSRPTFNKNHVDSKRLNNYHREINSQGTEKRPKVKKHASQSKGQKGYPGDILHFGMNRGPQHLSVSNQPPHTLSVQRNRNRPMSGTNIKPPTAKGMLDIKQNHQVPLSTTYSSNPPSTEFKKNREIFDLNQPPQALIEIPAPYLGNQGNPEVYKTKAISPATYSQFKEPLNQSSFNLYSTLTPSIPYSHRMYNMANSDYTEMSVPRNQRAGLVYGKAFERVLSPKNMQLRRFHQVSAITKDCEEGVVSNTSGLDINQIHLTTDRSNLLSSANSHPVGNIRGRKTKDMHDIGRRNSFGTRNSKQPFDFVVYTRITEKHNTEDSKKKQEVTLG